MSSTVFSLFEGKKLTFNFTFNYHYFVFFAVVQVIIVDLFGSILELLLFCCCFSSESTVCLFVGVPVMLISAV